MQFFPLNFEEIAICLSTPAGGAGEISAVYWQLVTAIDDEGV